MIKIARGLEALIDLFGKSVSVLNLLLMLSVVTTVVSTQLGWRIKTDFGFSVPVLGNGLTVNTLVDAQWYMFAYISMIGMSYTLKDDAHVRVDFISAALPRSWNHIINLLGNLIFLLPFMILMIWFSWRFVATSYISGEGSTYGGLESHWIVKFSLFFGFLLLMLAGVANTLKSIAAIFYVEDAV